MNNDEYYIGENERAYVNPTLSRDERLAFVDTLRNTMGANTAQINNATERLGTRIPSSMGGLTDSNAYFTQRYQTPFMESTANQLKATAQAKALNDLMTNAERQWANRMQQAYRGAKRRATTNLSDDIPSGLEIETTTNTGSPETTQVSTTDFQNALGKINSTPSGQLYYLDASPTRNKTPVYLENLTSQDDIQGVVGSLGRGYNGQHKFLNGVEYVYIDTGQFAPSWYRVGVGQGENSGW